MITDDFLNFIQRIWTKKQNYPFRLLQHVELAYVKQIIQLEAKDVLPNINRTQATERAAKCRFCLVTLTFDL